MPHFFLHKTLSLNLPNVEFDCRHHESPNRYIEVKFDVKVRPYANEYLMYVLGAAFFSTYTDTSKTLHRSRIRHLLFSVIEAYDHIFKGGTICNQLSQHIDLLFCFWDLLG